MKSEYDKLAAVGARLMVGRLSLEQLVAVRICCPQLAVCGGQTPPHLF